jgi:16S rRNA (cytidine1402-2'-O)-methyltransferase
MSKGILYLIPVPMGEEGKPHDVLPAQVMEITRTLRFFIAESAKTCRAFLKQVEMPVPLQEIAVESYGKHDRTETATSQFLKPLLDGHNVGLVSEAGCPAVADPGSEVVRAAHAKGIKVVPLVGPSSLLLSLMASGFNGQQFRFHGYLPIDKEERVQWIRDMEYDANKHHITQLFIETPFRNMQLFEALMSTLRAETALCIASDLTMPGESAVTKAVREWKKEKAPELHKVPAVFLIGK